MENEKDIYSTFPIKKEEDLSIFGIYIFKEQKQVASWNNIFKNISLLQMRLYLQLP